MGLFDAFTGKPGREAADQNINRLGQLKIDATGYLDAGKTGALGSYDNAIAAYTPLSALGDKYGAGTDLYLDSLGVNGAEGNARAVGAFQAGPGFDYSLDTQLDALDRRAASRGMLASGNTSLDTLNVANGLANQEYGNWQNRLAGLVSPELTAVGGAASGTAAGEAGKAATYLTDAQNRVNLATGVATGQNNAAIQGANAEMAGSANLWGGALQLAKLGTSFLGGSAGGGGK